MPQEIMRQWFVPGEGIDRHVISTDIQRYLGNDATVRPGLGTGEHQGVQGYWIKAYRNLTSAMITDLRADSARWRQEQRATGTRESYAGSSTYHFATTRASQNRRDGGDSPSVDGPYGLPPSSRDRLPTDTRMQIDPAAPQPRGYQPERTYQPEPRPSYPAERGYAPDNRAPYQPEGSMPAGYGRPPVSSSYGQDPRYSPSYQQASEVVPPGYMRQGNFFVPVPSSYDPAIPMPPSRSDPPQFAQGAYGQPQPGRDPREGRFQQPEYPDPRYAYPSPATTVSSVLARDHEPVSNLQQQPSPYGTMPQQYDQYGRPIPGLSAQQSTASKSSKARPGTYEGLPGATNGGNDRRSGRR